MFRRAAEGVDDDDGQAPAFLASAGQPAGGSPLEAADLNDASPARPVFGQRIEDVAFVGVQKAGDAFELRREVDEILRGPEAVGEQIGSTGDAAGDDGSRVL